MKRVRRTRTTSAGAWLAATCAATACIAAACGAEPADIADLPMPGAAGAVAMGGSTAMSVPGAGGTEVVMGQGGGAASGVTVLPPGTPSPGRVTAHRLNAREYDNTIRDLTQLPLSPSADFEFPEDEWGDGFNNDADRLTVSPLSIEKYLDAAQSVAHAVLAPENAAARAALLPCDLTADAACAETALGAFAERAFRRPLEAGELDRYLALIDVATQNGDTAEVGLEAAVAAVLVAPDFLYRIEPDPVPGAVRALNGYEIASRLSYFLWSTMPDAELFQAAADGALTEPTQIAAQVQRMLASERAEAFSNVMVEQWLFTAKLAEAQPNQDVFPTWQPALIGAFEQEVRAFFEPIFRGEVSSQDLLTADYVYANQLLGTFYGLPGAAQLSATEFSKVPLTDTVRGGVLRQGSFLVSTSKPASHSPTKRGKWILDRMICVRPPSPPAVVPEFDPAEVEGQFTLRQKLQMSHLQNAGCAACHALIDPMGFALEHYDGIGQWRDMDNGLPVDATGAMPDTAVPFDGAAELSTAIAADPRFASCIAKQVLTYALGRTTTADDKPAITELGTRFTDADYRFPDLVSAVATSPAMTSRHAEEVAP